MYAAVNGHGEVVRILLKAGADGKATNDDGKNALNLAHEGKKEDVAQLLK